MEKTKKQPRKKLNIIFVCTGNTCRSPMAEYMFKAFLKEKKRSADFSVSSAGLYAERGTELTANAHETLDALGIKHNETRKAKPFTVMMYEYNDVIIAMSESQAGMCGPDPDKIISFEQITGRPVLDPFGGSLDTYMACAAQMRSAFEQILEYCDNKPNV